MDSGLDSILGKWEEVERSGPVGTGCMQQTDHWDPLEELNSERLAGSSQPLELAWRAVIPEGRDL